MPELWLPENEDAEDLAHGDALGHIVKAQEFRAQLKAIDARLDLVWAKPGSQSVPQDERWYIIRRGDAGLGGIWMVANPDGSYCDPDERHLEALMARDGNRHPDVWRRVRAARMERKLMREKRREEQREQFRETLLDRLDHLYDARIAVTAEMRSRVPEGQAVEPGGAATEN
jgi:hypothetical protein